jgi:hypothetical protein
MDSFNTLVNKLSDMVVECEDNMIEGSAYRDTRMLKCELGHRLATGDFDSNIDAFVFTSLLEGLEHDTNVDNGKWKQSTRGVYLQNMQRKHSMYTSYSTNNMMRTIKHNKTEDLITCVLQESHTIKNARKTKEAIKLTVDRELEVEEISEFFLSEPTFFEIKTEKVFTINFDKKNKSSLPFVIMEMVWRGGDLNTAQKNVRENEPSYRVLCVLEHKLNKRCELELNFHNIIILSLEILRILCNSRQSIQPGKLRAI